MSPAALAQWELRFRAFLDRASTHDPAHDVQHVQRVLAAARTLAVLEGAELRVVVPAVWLHDCVNLPKDSPHARDASRLAAERAGQWLTEEAFPPEFVPGIRHCIEAHSFRAGITPITTEARVVQDADRLDALGAIGIARCFTVGGALGRSLYAAADPFCVSREPDDSRYTVDHFYAKLLKLPGSFQTAAGREEAERRAAFMRGYLDQLGREAGTLNGL